MIAVLRTTHADPAFTLLVAELDADLRDLYGAKQSEYDVFNKGLEGASVVLARHGDKPVGCGCFKAFGPDTAELKRMYVRPASRRLGVGGQLLTELEQWAREKGYTKTILQTANQQPEAIALYEKLGYRHIANYGSYVGDAASVCMEKTL